MNYAYSPLQLYKKKLINDIINGDLNHLIPADFKLSKEKITRFENLVTGKIVWPWSTDYDQDKQDFNNAYPTDPVLIVYVANYEDIRLCLDLAQDVTLWTVIRSGGHSLAGYSVCDGMVIDMSNLNDVYVDVNNKTAVVQAGCTFEKLFPILEMYGLHIPGGGCPTVAVAGYMQGGGYGLTSRMFGMHCDNVTSVKVMLADKQIVTASPIINSDLFWAIRGGTGGNFGVLLEISYTLHELGDIYGIRWKWPIEDYQNAATAITTIQNEYLSGSNYPQMGIETVLCVDTDNVKKVMFCASWIGDEISFMNALSPLEQIPGLQKEILTQGKYSKVNAKILDGTPVLPEGIKAFSRSIYISRDLFVSDWVNILQKYMTSPNSLTMVDMECYGGNIRTIPESSNAFIHRNVNMDFFCDAFFEENGTSRTDNQNWLEEFFEFMAQYGNGHSYQNYPNRLQTDYKQAYWGEAYPTLVAIKKKYDPENFFYYQQSIDISDEASELDNEAIVYEKY